MGARAWLVRRRCQGMAPAGPNTISLVLLVSIWHPKRNCGVADTWSHDGAWRFAASGIAIRIESRCSACERARRSRAPMHNQYGDRARLAKSYFRETPVTLAG